MADYYEVLGITRTATDDEIKRAYRAMARQYHPDSNPDDARRPRRSSRRSTIAYETLRDPERRRRYDVFGEEAPRGGGGPGPGRAGEAFGFGDIFDAFFGGDPFGNGRGQAGPPRAPDAEAVVNLDLAQAAFGTTATVDVRLPVSLRALRRFGVRAGHASGALRRVRRRRRGARGPAFDPRPDRDRGAVRRVQRDRQPHPHAVSASAAATGGCARRGRSTSRCPPASTTASASGSPAGARPRRAAASPATSTSPSGWPSDPRFERQGEDLVHVRTIAFTQATLGHAPRRRHARGARGARSSRPARSRGTCSGSRAGACPRSAAAAAATCSCASTWRSPPGCRPRRTTLLRSLADAPRRGGRGAGRQGRVLAAQVRVPVDRRS